MRETLPHLGILHNQVKLLVLGTDYILLRHCPKGSQATAKAVGFSLQCDGKPLLQLTYVIENEKKKMSLCPIRSFSTTN